jgi:hypothetical protein
MIEVIPPENDRGFPVIDFKFHNSGLATAFMWKFAIEVIEYELDLAAVLTGYVAASSLDRSSRLASDRRGGHALTIAVRNTGWGPFLNGTLVVTDPVIDQLVDIRDRTFLMSIEPDQVCELKIPASVIDQQRLDAMLHVEVEKQRHRLIAGQDALLAKWVNQAERRLQEDADRINRQKAQTWDFSNRFEFTRPEPVDEEAERAAFFANLDRELSDGIPGSADIRTNAPLVNASGSDHYGNAVTFQIQPAIGPFGGHISITRYGFEVSRRITVKSAAHSDTTYCTIVDLLAGYRREYNISRKIPPGDVERFQIMVGAKKSASIKAKFIFYLERGMAVQSDPFEFKVWHPIGSTIGDRYPDGMLLAQDGGDESLRRIRPWAQREFPFMPSKSNRSR